MTVVLNGVKNFLQLVNDNWTLIIVVCGLGVSVYKKAKSYIKLTNQQKIDLAWEKISKTMLSMVSDAESNWDDWKEAGSIKRAEVINRIFKEYPVLDKITTRDEVINRIDEMIDEALKEMRKIFQNNSEAEGE